jgi:hypothetical protein
MPIRIQKPDYHISALQGIDVQELDQIIGSVANQAQTGTTYGKALQLPDGRFLRVVVAACNTHWQGT